MISYELAKELKETGFPQEDRHCYWSDHTTPPTWWDINALDRAEQAVPIEHLYAAPTLEELIEACGEKLYGLCIWQDWKEGTKVFEGWLAYTDINMDGAPSKSEGPVARGSTPTEAVAKLWLALNKHA